MNYNAETVPELLSPRGPLAETLVAYEDRPFQRELALEVARLLEEGGRIAAEAPTGIGKSLGYCVPAAAWAGAGNGPVVVSTHTKALQEQLLHQEAPRLARVLGRDVDMRVLKGRTNYLCRRRYRGVVAQSTGEGTLALVQRIRPWVETTETGDFSELGDLSPRERQFLFARAASDSRFCAHSGCTPADGCFFKKARHLAGRAEILVINHALCAIHLFGDHDLLPAFDALIVDEAHGFVRSAIDHLTVSVGPGRVAAFLESLPGSGGFLPEALRSGEGAARLSTLHRSAGRLETETRTYFGKQNGAVPKGDPRQRYRDADAFSSLCPLSGESFHHALHTVLADGEALRRWAQEQGMGDGSDGPRTFLIELRRFQEEGRGIVEDLRTLTTPDPRESDDVTWKEWSGNTFSLSRTPLELGKALAPVLREEPSAVVFTSATLAAGDDFTFFAREVGLEGVLHAVAYPSPFAFDEQALVLAVRRAPDPREEGWPRTTARTLDRLMKDPGRKTLALFTSYRDLGRVHRILTEEGQTEAAPAYAVMAQGGAGEAPRLLESFRAAPRALLLGTASFWEGIDLPGEDLEILVLTRLPFGVPTDPRYQARAERLEEEGRNPFTSLYLPEAVLRFKQGFGRLIRRRSDRGVVAVLDPRLLNRGYGKRFAGALPVGINEAADPDDLAARAATWWDRVSRGDAS